jgi:hypothetical protein
MPPHRVWQQANDAWDRAKQACVELDVELAALRPLLRAANIRASDAQRQTRAEAFVAVAKLHLPWETYTTLWRLVEATAGLAPGGEEEEP